MPATLGALLADARLGLRLRTEVNQATLNAPIGWVATSELEDPTPYLQGGELLLTTGLRFPRGLARLRDYVARLKAAGVVGVGYGVGPVTSTVPRGLVAAAEELAVPLLEVDEPTPFIAIGKAVADHLAADERADLTRGFTGAQALTRAAVGGGTRGLISRLATVISGWAGLVDPHGQIRHLAPASARGAASAVTGELGRLRGRHAALAVVHGDANVVAQPLTPSSTRRGFLVVGFDRPPSATDRSLVNVAAALLSFDLEHGRRDQTLARSTALLRLVLDGIRLPDELLAGLGGAILTRRSVQVAALTAEPGVLSAYAADLAADLGDAVLAGLIDATLIAVTAPDVDVRTLVQAIPGTGAVAVGISRTSDGRVADAIYQARHAAAAAARPGPAAGAQAPAILDFDHLRSTSALGLLDPLALRAFADRLLRPLDEYAAATGIDLVASLAAWLDHHGQYDPAAASLNVHRHTLRYRIQKAQTLLGRKLTTMDARTELWLAISARSSGLAGTAAQSSEAVVRSG